jgi:Tetratricopeptide repeat
MDLGRLMRHLIFCGTAILLVLAARHATAQVLRFPVNSRGGNVGSPGVSTPQGESSSPPFRSWSKPPRQAPSVEEPSAPVARLPRDGRDQSGNRHAHHRGRSGGWFDGGFPGVWNGPYVAGFPLYYPSYRYVGYYVVAPPIAAPLVINPAPVGVAGALPAARAANNQAGPAPAPERPSAPKPKTSHAQQKARAGRFIGFGDANFAKQNYNSAVERYKTAMEIAPDVAESYFRQAFAQVAMGQYDKAAAAFRRGLRIRSDWTGSPFRLDQIYDGAALAKTSHIERLAKEVEANPFDAELLLVLGMQLFFDGKQDRADVFFARAAQLGGNEDQLLDDFLPKPKPDGAADPHQAPGKIVF